MSLDLAVQNLLVIFEESKLDIRDDNRVLILRADFRSLSFLGNLLKCTSLLVLPTTHTRENSLELYVHYTDYATLNLYFQKGPLFFFFLASKFWEVGSPHFFLQSGSIPEVLLVSISHGTDWEVLPKLAVRQTSFWPYIFLLKTHTCRPAGIHALDSRPAAACALWAVMFCRGVLIITCHPQLWSTFLCLDKHQGMTDNCDSQEIWVQVHLCHTLCVFSWALFQL